MYFSFCALPSWRSTGVKPDTYAYTYRDREDISFPCSTVLALKRVEGLTCSY